MDGDQRGTWSGDWKAPSLNGDNSPAVVALYEYRGAGGQLVYSTDPQLSNAALKRSEAPVCRVWKNPQTVLVLDGKAVPVRPE